MFKRKAFYLPADSGHLFCLHYIPEQRSIANTLFFPPFAEELNRSRHLMSLMAAQLAENGHEVLIVDLFGTGDSEGDFGDAAWSIWKQDMLQALNYLQQQNTLPVNFLTIRSGTLLALDLMGEPSSTSQVPIIEKLIAWQPVFNTDKFIQQFLRLQLAGNLFKQSQYKTTEAIKQHLIQTGSIEIAGYTLTAKLMNDILSLSNLKNINKKIQYCHHFSFFQISTTSATHFSKEIQLFLTRYPQIKDKINIQSISASPFWQVYDIKDIIELRNLTLAQLSFKMKTLQ